MNKRLLFFVSIAVVLFGTFLFFRFGNSGTTALWNLSDSGQWLLPLVGVAALIDSINPCAFSILLLTIAFLISLGKMRTSILTIGGFYVAGIFIVYMLIGLGILQVLHLFNTPHFMAKVGAVVLIAFGALNIVNEVFPSFPIKIRPLSAVRSSMAKLIERGSIPMVFFLGVLVGLCEFPCTGGPYLMVLGLLHDQKTWAAGFGYLLFYNLVFILPLVVILLIASEKTLIEKVRAWKKAQTKHMKIVGGIAMVILGIFIFFL